MTTSVYISTTYVHPGKKLRIRAVSPKDETQIWSEQFATQQDVEEKGVDIGNGVKSVKFEIMHVHDSAKLIVEEVE